MKNHYRFLALMISCTLAGAAPMSALCSEAVSAGGTAAAAETAAEEEPGTEDLEEEIAEEAAAEEAAAEEAPGTEVQEEEAAEEPSGTIEETTGEIPEGAVTVEAGTEDTAEEPAGNEETENAEVSESYLPEEEEALPVTEGYCGEGLTWEYIEGTLYIKGTGGMYDYDEEDRPEWMDYADRIAELRIDRGITLVDGDAFEGLKELRTIYFEGSEKEWKELAYENDRTGEEETGTAGVEGAKGAFAGVTGYYFGEEDPEEEAPEEAAEETGEPEEPAAAGPKRAAAQAAAESLEIVTEPEDTRAAVGENVTLHVEANMEADYQWQWSRDGKTWKDCTSAGYDTDTFSFVMKETLNGRKYRCIVFNDSDEIITRTAEVTVAAEEEALEITSQPVDITAAVGEQVSVHVEANRTDAAYRWQWSRDGGTWKDCTSAGYNTDTFSFVMKETLNGRHYRCVVTSGSEQAVSEEAVVHTAEDELRIISQPEDTAVAAGQTAGFRVEVNKADAAYKWQWSADSGKTWKDCKSKGYNTATLSFVMSEAYSGRQYRCIVTSGSRQVTSRAATVSFKEGLRITSQPEDVSASAGETVNFHVEANKDDVTYRWQWSANGTTWKNCASAGYDTDTMHFEMRDTYDGRKYRCIVTSGTEQVTSTAATVEFKEGLRITSQPANVTAGSGETVNLHAAANRTDVKYQWQWSANGTTWKNCASAGYNTDTMHFEMRDTYDGRKYRCIVTSGSEQVISAAATVLFAEPVEIETEPEDAEAEEGAAVSFHVEASRAGVTYKWQWSADNGKTWKDCKSKGYNTATLSFVMSEAYSGRKYRCIVTAGTQSVTSREALLTLAEPEIVIEGVVYELIDDVMTVTGYRGTADDVVVQETVEGHTVTVIGESAFEGSTIRSIDLPDTVQLIRKRAFANCSNLTSMN